MFDEHVDEHGSSYTNAYLNPCSLKSQFQEKKIIQDKVD